MGRMTPARETVERPIDSVTRAEVDEIYWRPDPEGRATGDAVRDGGLEIEGGATHRSNRLSEMCKHRSDKLKSGFVRRRLHSSDKSHSRRRGAARAEVCKGGHPPGRRRRNAVDAKRLARVCASRTGCEKGTDEAGFRSLVQPGPLAALPPQSHLSGKSEPR